MDLNSFIENIYKPVTEISVLGVELLHIIIFLLYSVIFFAAFFIIKNVILKRLEEQVQKSTNRLDDSIITFVRKINYIFYLSFALYLSSQMISIGETPTKVIKVLFTVILVYEIIVLVQNITIHLIQRYWIINGSDDDDNKTAIEGMTLIIRIVLWLIGLLIVLTNLGVKITALVASLGVTSVAVAFALQNVLSDIFSSFSIYLDKPFRVNDFIIVGTDMGVVTKIGVKTTRIQTLNGEELVISNHELTSTRIHNFKKMEKRRIVFTIGVVYGTSASMLRKIPVFIKDIIDAQDTAEFDRSHFFSYGDFSLNFETVYYVTSNDYNIYMDTQHSINLGIYEKFEKEGIEFAYPTQTIYTKKG
ncbi:MAG: mechanosensitive ion channel family protein [Spirochaetota bacterium]